MFSWNGAIYYDAEVHTPGCIKLPLLIENSQPETYTFVLLLYIQLSLRNLFLLGCITHLGLFGFFPICEHDNRESMIMHIFINKKG